MRLLPFCQMIAALALSAALPAVVQASETAKPDAFVLQFFGKDPFVQKTAVCLMRVYDANHMAKHPKQKVAAMLLLVTGEPDGETKTATYSYKMGVKFRGQSKVYEATGGCDHAAEAVDQGKAKAVFGCDHGCDEGGFDISLVNRDTALLKLSHIPISEKGKEPGQDDKTLEAGADDRVFQLNRASLADCAPIEDKKQSAAAGD